MESARSTSGIYGITTLDNASIISDTGQQHRPELYMDTSTLCRPHYQSMGELGPYINYAYLLTVVS